MIYHIPQASTNKLGKSFKCDVTKELERTTDIRTESLFEHRSVKIVKTQTSRLICDVERFDDDME
jgi:hypothetical protein